MNLADWSRLPFEALAGRSVSICRIDGMWAKTGSPAVSRGVFRPVIDVDPRLRAEPTWFQCFVLRHEVEHVVRRHALKFVVALVLFFPLALWLRQKFEADADKAAAVYLTPAQFLLGSYRVHKRGLSSRWLFGRDPVARTTRAGYGLRRAA